MCGIWCNNFTGTFLKENQTNKQTNSNKNKAKSQAAHLLVVCNMYVTSHVECHMYITCKLSHVYHMYVTIKSHVSHTYVTICMSHVVTYTSQVSHVVCAFLYTGPKKTMVILMLTLLNKFL